MKKAVGNIDWLEVLIPGDDEHDNAVLRVHLNFMLSNWECIYGRGCPGMFGVQSSMVVDDTGCCGQSFWFNGREDYQRVEARMAELTDEDWDAELRKHVNRNGWAIVYKDGDPEDDDDFNGKGKVYDGGCVFQNRNNGSTGKPGCAFHHLGERTGRRHVDVMPYVCWQLPLRFWEEEVGLWVLAPWDVDKWGEPTEEEGTHNAYCAWWCMDSPDAFIGDNPVYKSLEDTIRETVGDEAYDLMVVAIEERIAAGNTYANMPGATVNGGRPLLPLIVGNRTPRREPSDFPVYLQKMKDSTS